MAGSTEIQIRNFLKASNCQKIDAASTAATALSCGAGQAEALAVYNSGTDIVFFGFGSSSISITAPTTGTSQPVLVAPPGAMIVVAIPPTATHIGTLANSGTQSIYIIPGAGS